MQPITQTATAVVTNEDNINQQNEKITTNYFVLDVAYKISINTENKSYICNHKQPHIMKNPVRCGKNHLSCYKCSVLVPISGSEEFKRTCPVCYISLAEDSIDLPEQAFRFRKDNVVENNINSILLGCPAKNTFNLEDNCNWEGCLKDLRFHLLRDCQISPKDECKHHKLPQSTATLIDITTNIIKLQKKLTTISEDKTVEKLKQEVSNLKETVKSIEDVIFNKATKSIINFAEKHVNGTLVWKIDNFNMKFQKAQQGMETYIYSPPFYTKEFGYKLAAKIYLNSTTPYIGTHLSVGIAVMNGEYDAILRWPLNNKNINFTLIDQNNQNHLSFSVNADPQSACFQRPHSEFNTDLSIQDFVDHERLIRIYVKDDTIFFKIDVTNISP